MMTKTRCRQYVSLILLAIIILAFSYLSQKGEEKNPFEPIVQNRQSTVAELWVIDNVYIGKYHQHQLVVEDDKLVFIGKKATVSDEQNVIAIESDQHKVIAVESGTGKELWRYDAGSEVSIATNSSLVFVGGIGKIRAINISSGELVWTTRYPFTSSILKLVVREDVLHVDTAGMKYFRLKCDTGEIIITSSDVTEEVPYWSYYHGDAEIEGNTRYLYKKVGSSVSNIITEIIAIDNQSNSQLWATKVDSVTRVATNSLGAYLLTPEGFLIRLDAADGNLTNLIQFTPALNLRKYYEDGLASELGYHLTVDKYNHQLFVYFGDSAQIFAFQLPVSQ
jgi:outer membrane protein assembly factor BamB